MLEPKANGIKKKLVAIKFWRTEECLDMAMLLLMREERKLAWVTSGISSPTLNCSIGLCYVPTELSKEGSIVYVSVGSKT